jgi:hypothetical protein
MTGVLLSILAILAFAFLWVLDTANMIGAL